MHVYILHCGPTANICLNIKDKNVADDKKYTYIYIGTGFVIFSYSRIYIRFV